MTDTLRDKFDYKTAIPGTGPGKTALLIVDFTDHYIHDRANASLIDNRYDKAVATTRYLSDNLRKAAPDMPQIWVADGTVRDDIDFYEIDRRDKNKDAEFIKEHFYKLKSLSRDDVLAHYGEFRQKPQDGVFLKTRHDAFQDAWEVDGKESLADYLRARDIHNLLICGGKLTDCVMRTYRGAEREGFKARLVYEGVAGGFSFDRSKTFEGLEDEGIFSQSVGPILNYFNIDRAPLVEKHNEIARNMPQPSGFFERVINFWREPS